MRAAAQFLDLEFHFPQENIQQVLPVAAIGPKDHAGIGEHFELAPVLQLQHRVAVRTGDNHFTRLDELVGANRP